jgi:uncharacterized protein YutE (UPF0331/DUF86 family)
MTPHQISKRIVVDRLEAIDFLLKEIQSLPLLDRQMFFSDRRNIWAAESCLRRSLEALFDAGRHILTKGFGLGISEYKEISVRLKEQAVLSEEEAGILKILAAYRNRLVHFYHEVSNQELYEICRNRLGDINMVQGALKKWLRQHPDKIDTSL